MRRIGIVGMGHEFPRSLSARTQALAWILATAALVAPLACGDSDNAGDQPVAARSPSPTLAAADAELTVTATDYAFDFPATLPEGEIKITMVNAGAEKHILDIIKLTPDAPPIDDLLELPEKKAERYFQENFGFIHPTRPGKTAEEQITGELTPGTYAYACFIETKDGMPHAFLGMAGTFAVEVER